MTHTLPIFYSSEGVDREKERIYATDVLDTNQVILEDVGMESDGSVVENTGPRFDSQSPRGWLTTNCDPSSRRSDILL